MEAELVVSVSAALRGKLVSRYIKTLITCQFLLQTIDVLKLIILQLACVFFFFFCNDFMAPPGESAPPAVYLHELTSSGWKFVFSF